MPVFKVTNWSYRALLLAGLAVYALCARASEGFYHPDEHFQILEFANYKLGLTPAAELAWEFRAEIRPALQPAMVVGLVKVLHAVGSFNPFTTAFLLRLISGWLAILVYARLSRMVARDFVAESSGKLLLALAVFTWFVPFLSVRFSSESWSALAFLYGVSLLPFSGDDAEGSASRFAIAGLLLGFSFVFRLQMAFALVGVMAWLLFQRRIRWTNTALLLAGGLCAVLIGIATDYWFYGHFVLTSWQYFQVNVLQGKASQFGVAPWWFYVPKFLKVAVPPISLVLLVLASVGLWRKARHLFSWVMIPFVIGHVLVAHKELRFFFPVVFPFLWLVVSGWEDWKARFRMGKLATVGWRCCIVINGIALLYVCVRPAQQFLPSWRFLYDYSHDRHVMLYSEQRSPYRIDPLLGLHFYDAPNLTVVAVDSLGTVGSNSRAPQAGDLLLQRHYGPPPVVPGYRLERVFRAFPDWVLPLDFTHWEKRTEIWTIYRISGTT